MEFLEIIIILILAILALMLFFAGRALGRRQMFDVMQTVLDKEKKEAIEKSRSILKGQFSEQLSPFNQDFPVKSSECRFFGAPIDFVAFRGLDDQQVREIVFIEIKTGNARLNKTEKSIKEAIDNKQVRFEEYRI